MPPKKKSTCDAATDLPHPIEYDPFNLDGHRLRNDFIVLPKFTWQILEKLKQQRTTGAPKLVKDKVVGNLEMLLDWMHSFAFTLNQSRTFSNRLQSIEHEIRESKKELHETKKELSEIKAATKDVPPGKNLGSNRSNQHSCNKLHLRRSNSMREPQTGTRKD